MLRKKENPRVMLPAKHKASDWAVQCIDGNVVSESGSERGGIGWRERGGKGKRRGGRRWQFKLPDSLWEKVSANAGIAGEGENCLVVKRVWYLGRGRQVPELRS